MHTSLAQKQNHGGMKKIACISFNYTVKKNNYSVNECMHWMEMNAVEKDRVK